MSKNNNIPACRNCKYFRCEVCVVHQRRIKENACCSHWELTTEKCSESDLRISVEHLREVLESHFAHRILPSEIDEIINQVKKEI